MSEEASCSGAWDGEQPPLTESWTSRWYGWQLLLADAVSASVLLVGGTRPFLLAYTLMPPLLHAANGQGGRVMGSIGMRLLPLVVGVGVAVMSSACWEGKMEWETCTDPMPLFLATAVLVSLADAGLALKPAAAPPPPAGSRPAAKSPGPSLNIGVLPYRQGAGLGLSGRF
jgi:hypothetical protein